MGQPDKEYLEVVYASYLGAVLRSTLPGHAVWGSGSKVAQLASSMVQMYLQMKQSFAVDDQSHYLFTPKHLTEWCLGLVRYAAPDGGGGDSRSAGAVLKG